MATVFGILEMDGIGVAGEKECADNSLVHRVDDFVFLKVFLLIIKRLILASFIP